MQTVDCLIVHAAQVVTCGDGTPKRGDRMRDVGIIPDGAIAIHGGNIVAVGKTADIRAQYHAEHLIDATGRAVLPGLVDCHTHAVFAGSRLDEFELRIQGKSYMDIMAAGGGIASTMRSTRAATVEELTQQAEKRLRGMLALGTTTVEIKTGYGLDIASEVAMLKAIDAVDARVPQTIIPTFLGAHALPPEYATVADYAEMIEQDMLPAIYEAYQQTGFYERGVPLAIDIFCEQGVFDRETTRKLLQAGRDGWQMPIKAHVDEFVNLRGVTTAVELGALSVDHLDVTPVDELELLAQSNTVGVMLPAVNFNLGSTHYGNARHLIDAGGLLALSTDYNPGSAPTLSLPMVMAIACRYQKLSPAEALNACTINAAAALNLQGKIGVLASGYQADVIILEGNDYRALTYEFGAGMVQQVMIEGKTVWTTSS